MKETNKDITFKLVCLQSQSKSHASPLFCVFLCADVFEQWSFKLQAKKIEFREPIKRTLFANVHLFLLWCFLVKACVNEACSSANKNYFCEQMKRTSFAN